MKIENLDSILVKFTGKIAPVTHNLRAMFGKSVQDLE